MDRLAVVTQRLLREVKASLAKRGVTVDLNALEPWQDPQVWEMISGGARAMHHIESPAMTALCRQCTPCNQFAGSGELNDSHSKL
jgi:hypothetical protein